MAKEHPGHWVKADAPGMQGGERVRIVQTGVEGQWNNGFWPDGGTTFSLSGEVLEAAGLDFEKYEHVDTLPKFVGLYADAEELHKRKLYWLSPMGEWSTTRNGRWETTDWRRVPVDVVQLIAESVMEEAVAKARAESCSSDCCGRSHPLGIKSPSGEVLAETIAAVKREADKGVIRGYL